MKILVVGGGVGGMCAATMLGRDGHQVKLVDADPEWRALGAGMTLHGGALRAFHQMGVLDTVKAQGACGGAGMMMTSDGEVIAMAPPGSPFGPDIPAVGGIMRPVLHKILQAETRKAGVEVQLGFALVGLDQQQGTATARFSDGSEADYDLVVGADGVNSTIRSLIMPDARRPSFTGQGCWRAVVPRPPEVTGPCGFFGKQKCGLNPVSATEMYLFHLHNVPDNPFMPEDRWVDLLKEQLEEFTHPLIRHIRDTLDEASLINYRPLESGILPAPWFKGRVVLIGDAAHATTPHSAYGAGLAIEDGIVLAEELGRGVPLDAALEAFMRRRYDRCKAIVDGSVRLCKLEQIHAPMPEYASAMQDVTQVVVQPFAEPRVAL